MEKNDDAKSIPWQTWFSSAASIIFTISSIVFWETRNIVYDTKAVQIKVVERIDGIETRMKENVRSIEVLQEKMHDIERSHDRYVDTLQYVPVLRKELETANIRLIGIENSQKALDARMIALLQRIALMHQTMINKTGKAENFNAIE